MSSFRRPVGPESSRVYWRRRALVLGVLLLIVVVVVLIVVGRGSGASSASAPGASASAGESSGAPVPGAGSSRTPSSSPSAAPSSSAGRRPPPPLRRCGACSDDQIELTPVLDKTAYGPTEDPRSRCRSRTPAPTPATWTSVRRSRCSPSAPARAVLVVEGLPDRGTNQDVTIKAGQELTTPAIEWDRTRSSTTTCDSSRPSVTGGGASYHLQVGWGTWSRRSRRSSS